MCFFGGVAFFAAVVALVPEQSFESMVTTTEKGKGGKAKKLSKEYRKILLSGAVTAFGITLHNFPEVRRPDFDPRLCRL